MNGTPTGAPGKGGGKKQRREMWGQYYQDQVAPNLPEYMQQGLANRPGTQRRLAQGYLKRGSLGRETGRLGSLREMSPGYGASGTATREGYLGEVANLEAGGEPVNFRREGVDYERGGRPVSQAVGGYATEHMGAAGLQDSPMLADLSKYTRERLGTGLTPQEEAVFRGKGIETAEAAAAESRRQLGNSFGASGMDPRAASAAMGRLERGRMQERSGVERNIIEQELARKKEIEQLGGLVSGQELQRLGQTEDLASKMAGLEEGAREFDVGTAEGARRYDVGADLQRRQQLEQLGLGLGAQEEERFKYDTGFVEGRRQARQNRQLLRDLQRSAAPSGIERAGAILGGIRGALSMGG